MRHFLFTLALAGLACGDNASEKPPETQVAACEVLADRVCSLAVECGEPVEYQDCYPFIEGICNRGPDPRDDWDSCDWVCEDITGATWYTGECFQ